MCYVPASTAWRRGTTTRSSGCGATRRPRKSRAPSRSWPPRTTPTATRTTPARPRAVQGDRPGLPGAVRPEPPRHVRPLRPPRGGARVALRLERAVPGRVRRHQRHRHRRHPGRPARRLRRRPGRQGRHQARARADASRRPRSAARSRCATSASSSCSDCRGRAPRRDVPGGVRGLQRAGSGALPAGHLPHRGRADVLAVPRDGAHRADAVQRVPRQRPHVDVASRSTVTIPAGVERGATKLVHGRRQQAAPRQGARAISEITITVRAHAVLPPRRATTSVHRAGDVHARRARAARSRCPTLDGKGKLRVPAGTQPGTVLRIKGKGIPRRGGLGRGDQRVEVAIEVPTQLTERQRRLLERARQGARRGRPAAAQVVHEQAARSLRLRAPTGRQAEDVLHQPLVVGGVALGRRSPRRRRRR